MSKLKLDDIVKLNKRFWQKLATGSTESIKQWIDIDALNGIMQNEKSSLQYKSQTYKKYKANDMRRFTADKKTGRKKVTKKYKERNYLSSQRLKGYAGFTLNNDVSKVNLHLTNRMIKSLFTKEIGDNYVIMSYGEDQAGKVIGNKARGYDVVGLNLKNIEKVRQRIIEQYEVNKNNTLSKIVITIGS